MTKSAKLGFYFVVLSIIALAQAAKAENARFIKLDFPGAKSTYAYGINPAGDIVGAYVDSAGKERGFVFRNSVFTTIDIPDAGWTECYGITPEGDIAGQYWVPGDPDIHGFLLWQGDLYTVDVPDQPNTMPLGIGPGGTIAGCVHGGPDGMHGFVITVDGDSQLDPVVNAMHTGINASGEITGYQANPGRPDSSYVISNGVRTEFTFPGSTFTRARGIGPTGDIVGIYQDAATKKFHGFLLHNGDMVSIDVDLPGTTLTRAFGINAVGDIVGYYQDETGFHGFLLTRRGPK